MKKHAELAADLMSDKALWAALERRLEYLDQAMPRGAGWVIMRLAALEARQIEIELKMRAAQGHLW
jgi:hypothetical protein